MKWNEKPLTGFSKALFDCFKTPDLNQQVKNLENLGKLIESKPDGRA